MTRDEAKQLVRELDAAGVGFYPQCFWTTEPNEPIPEDFPLYTLAPDAWDVVYEPVFPEYPDGHPDAPLVNRVSTAYRFVPDFRRQLEWAAGEVAAEKAEAQDAKREADADL